MIQKINVDLIAGARPNFMKIAPLIHAIETTDRIHFRLVHTGQHYDDNMSKVFFRQLGIPNPEINLSAGSGTQAEQTAAIMIGYEKVLSIKKPDLCIVVGDVTSTMACSIVSKKMEVKVAHVEAGIRSWDWSMPEEINRIVTDSITDYFFTTSETANHNLVNSGVDKRNIFFVGNTMIDTLLRNKPRFSCPEIWNRIGLKDKEFIVLTLHRPANVDDEVNLKELVSEIVSSAKGLPLIFPVHPRTLKILNGIGVSYPNLHLIEPLGYLEFNYLVEHSKAVITDSGGITEETTVMGIPCITLRDSTERPETVTVGTNELIGTDPSAIRPVMDILFSGKWKKGKVPDLWDGHASERIIKNIIDIFSGDYNQLHGKMK